MSLLTFLKNDFFLDAGTVINGNVLTKNSANIAGTINGDLHGVGNVTIEKTGLINGHVKAGSVIVKGRVKGNIYCTSKIYLHKQSSVQGNIFADEAIVDKDSSISGTISKLHSKHEDIVPGIIEIPELPEELPGVDPVVVFATENKIATSDNPPTTWF